MITTVRVTGIDDGFSGGVKRDVSYNGDTTYTMAPLNFILIVIYDYIKMT